MLKRNDKRGLSTIVATLLIILLTLVAVGIIWVVVRNVIQGGSEQISLGKFTLDLKISQVQKINDSALSVTLKRNAGEGDFVGISFVVEDDTGTEVVKQNVSMSELQTKTYQLYFLIINTSRLKKISIAPIFRLESGKEVNGDVKDTYFVGSSGSENNNVIIPPIPSAPVYLRTFYINATTGNDANDGMSPSTPWKTIAKINSYMLFQPGDGILFERGQTWRETLTIPSSGNSTHYIAFGNYGGNVNKPKLFGSAAITGWTRDSGNVWISNNNVSNPKGGYWPGSIFFRETDGNITWGHAQKTLKTDLTVNYDWTWISNKIYIYSDDPNTNYSGVEVAQRQSIIYLNNKNYITIDGLELRYSCATGIEDMYPTTANTGLVVKNCEIGYFSIKGGNIGYGIAASDSNMLIKNNIIHDCGRRGISVHIYATDNLNVSNIMVENNTFYNGFHTTSLDSAVGTGGEINSHINNITFRNNLIYEDKDVNVTAPEGYGSATIYFEGRNASNLNDIYVYNNIIKFTSGSGVHFDSVIGNSYVYNNIFYGVNSKATNNLFLVNYETYSKNAVIKNNIFYGTGNFSVYHYSAGLYEMTNQDHKEIDANYNLYWQEDSRIPVVWATGRIWLTSEWDAMKNATGWESNSSAPANPLFVDPENNDFHLQSNSPAKWAGTPIPGLTRDYEGQLYNTTRPSIGAFEYP
jgi:hypothetical protein